MGPFRDILCTTLVVSILVFGSVFEENILPEVESQLSSTLKIIKLTAGIEDTFDFIVAGPTSYNPSISTVGTPGGEITPNSNSGTYGSSADGKYFENDIQTNFNTVPGILNSGVLQEGTEQLQDQGEIRFGTNSQWDFLHTPTGSNIMSINLWFRGDIVDDGGQGDDFPILSTLNPDAGDTNGILLYLRNDNLRLSIIENGVTIEDSNLNVGFSLTNDGQWHMITLAIDHGNTISEEIIPCLDAVCSQEFRDQPFAGGGGTADKTLTIGSQSVIAGDTPVEPSFEVDDFTIWHGYYLTSSDITSLYNGGSGVSAGVTGLGISLANQVGHWTFDTQTSSGIGIDGPNPVEPGIYTIQETIQAGWALTSVNCNDGSSSFDGVTVEGIAIDPGDNIECTFVNLPSSTDTDGDGIYNEVDTLPDTSSDDFSDVGLGGTSSGTITTRGDQILTITEEPNPAGVRIADISGGLTPATVSVCVGASKIALSPGDKIIVTCGSATIDVIDGPVEVIFISSGGTQATATVTQGNSITFDPDTFSFSAPSTNVDPVVVIVEGQQITINPGEGTSILSSNKDSFLKQGPPNTNEGANRMMRVRDDGNNRALISFDQNEILAASQERTLSSATLRLYIEENGNTWGPNGRTIDIHRLLADWTEGNGFNDKPASITLSQFNVLKNRGDGPGVTWKCATDTEINNQQTNCSPQWNGATFSSTPTDTITIFKDNPPTGTVKTVGWIEFDVTADLQAFLSTEQNYGWIVKKTQEGESGLVEFTSDESPANTPELVLVFEGQ